MATPSLSRSYIRSRTALTLPSSHTGNSLSLQPTATALHQQLLPQGQLLDKFMELIQYMRDFTSETSATLLDASQGVLDCQERWELMQLHQQMFCGSPLHLTPIPHTTTARFSNVSLTVYDNNDIVSGFLKAGTSWENAEVHELLWALRQPIPQAGGSMGSNKSPLVIDIGANVGWFTINAAAAGARVAAFEAMYTNQRLLRNTLCANPWLHARIALFATGLGDRNGLCYMLSSASNQGDGITECDKEELNHDLENHIKKNETYKVHGFISIRRLDDVIMEDVQVLKIDIEGFETRALKGATRLFRRHNVWYLLTECNEAYLGQDGVKEYLRFLHGLDFLLSNHSFKGPFLREADIVLGAVQLKTINLFCVNKSLYQQQQAARRRSGELAATAEA
eukprot:jgi/Chrzof1/6700/Cz19g06040.t1